MTVGDGLQLSVNEVAEYDPTCPWQLALAFTVALAGQVMLGAVTSFRVTVKVQLAELPLPSLAIRVTVWAALWPVSIVEEAGLWFTVGDGLQLSDNDVAE